MYNKSSKIYDNNKIYNTHTNTKQLHMDLLHMFRYYKLTFIHFSYYFFLFRKKV